MLTFEEAQALFEADHWSVRTRARWQDAADDNFAAAYKFCTGIYNNHQELVPDEETLPAVVRRAFPRDQDCQNLKMLGEFKKLDLSLSRKDIYNLWVKRFKRIRQDGVQPDLSILKIFVSQVRKAQRTLLETPLSNETIVKVASTILYHLSKGVWLEIKVIASQIERYSKSEFLRFKAADCNLESADVDAILYNKDTRENVEIISIKTEGALSISSIRKWRDKVRKKNENYFRRTGRRRPEVTVWIGVKDEHDTELTVIRPADLD
jgi:hypothetical protein